jgi:hypothetical protein
MAMPIMVVASIKLNPPRRSAHGSTTRERVITYEGSSGPRELMEAIVIQAGAAIKGLEGVAKAAEEQETEMTEEQKRVTNETKGKGKERVIAVLSEENQKLLSFCRRILATANAIDRSLRETKGDAFVERLHASLPKLSSSNDEAYIDHGASDEAIEKAYVAWATRARFEYCDLTIPPEEGKPVNTDEPPNYKFFFNNEARMLATSDIPKRSLAIAKEVRSAVQGHVG